MTPFILSLLRTHYRDLQGYVSAGMEHAKSAEKIFLNANENPYELPGLEGYSQYPEPQPAILRDGYAALYGTQADRIVMTRGADEAIAVLTKLFCEPHEDSIIINPPTFGMYGVNASTMPAGTISVPLIEDNGAFSLNVQGVIDALPTSKLVFLCSPNNPTGTSFDREDILQIIEAAEGQAIVVLDETYIEFAQADSFTDALAVHPHLIILRTLSKSYALAGMRMGSMLCGDSDLAALIRTKGLDAYPLPRASIDAALHIMKPDINAIAHANIQTIVQERTRMENAFKASAAVDTVYPSDTNFLLIKMPHVKAFIAACAAQNIIIRDFSDKDGTKNCMRLSIGTPEQNDKVLTILNALT